MYSFKYSIKVSFESISDNPRHQDWNPRPTKYIKVFQNLTSKKLFFISDLEISISKRKEVLTNFFESFWGRYSENKISIITAVVSNKAYTNASVMIDSIKKKLKRKNIKLLGYIWQRDVGEKKYKNHFHLLLATSIITPEDLEALFVNNEKSSAEFLKTKNGMRKYLEIKNFYCAPRGRNFGSSTNVNRRKKNNKKNNKVKEVCVFNIQQIMDKANASTRKPLSPVITFNFNSQKIPPRVPAQPKSKMHKNSNHKIPIKSLKHHQHV